ncbi:protein ROOT PRIMORDIUM DEFECTIVE 1 [Cucumis melo var. makuwa]|uniref:Protein ROOT PRIMORDIUM DEFECTIVE 1 n=2 Tax=Cucumis melo TaxID=3656 RepID=A0A5A7T0U1_CUCMM|nr:protein ROOT PRIMORDIUM DEFECTIVE 1 [Cucumis melo var. makuwa]TYJ99978.1 protein ROOT PRIMORDIUM DEFECTIVE 1 [Cucumis melo var. makuwa]
MILQITRIPHRFTQIRAFVDAKVKWVRDPYLDFAVQREKNLKQVISLKNIIISSPLTSVPLSSVSLLKQNLKVPTTTISKFFELYPSVFIQFQPSLGLHPHVKITSQALLLHKEESTIHNSRPHRDDVVKRLAKLLMLTGAGKLPLYVIEKLQWDLGLPYRFIPTLLADYPDYFQVCSVKDCLTGEQTLALELLSWRKDLAVSELKKREYLEGNFGSRKRNRIAFPMSFPRGFDLQKKVMNWVEEWQHLPYISPYENAFHLAPNSDQAEKWAVAVLHELLYLTISKKTEKENIYCLGDYLGFGSRFKKAIVHHPGIFYVSNKIRTQTVVLREAYKKDFLLEKHPLMGMRHQYLHLMNKVIRKPRPGIILASSRGKRRNIALANKEV